MNRAEKAVEQAKLDREKAVLKELQEHYEYALNSINERLRVLQAAPETQSSVYHIQYQKTMQKQVSDILANLRANEYNTIDQYMHDAYTTGYVGTMYSLHNQNMPLTIPINQDAVLRSVQHNTKLTSPLYDELGIDTRKMQKSINRELSRGLSSGLTYDEIARNIRNTTKAPLARAKLIARTEGHRIHEESSYDAAVAAKAEGADLVKQWDATLDGDTRPNHKQLDTQIRELEEPFEVGTFKPMHPGDFGTAKEDCNCRCVSLKRARWALDEAELEEMKERAKQFGLDKSDEFADFEKKYLKAAEKTDETLEKSRKSGIISLEKDPFYDGLSKEDIASRYIKPDGSNLLGKDVLELPVGTQRELVRGYDKAIELYGNIPPQRIKTGNLHNKVFAKYSLDYKTITVNPDMITESGQAFATMIHEMTHHAENIKLFSGDDVLKRAFQKMGLRSNTRQAEAMKMRTVGSATGNDHTKSAEIVAYAVERQMTGRGNPLTEAIYDVLKEKGVIK